LKRTQNTAKKGKSSIISFSSPTHPRKMQKAFFHTNAGCIGETWATGLSSPVQRIGWRITRQKGQLWDSLNS